MEPQKRYTERRGGLIILSVTIAIILLIVISGILVSIFVERFVANIILCALIGLLLLVGLLSFTIIRLHKREAERRRDMSSQQWARAALNDRHQRVEPSAPPMSTRTSWALIKPWRYSKRSTIQRA